MKTPTLEEVKEYFKNAKEVKSMYDGTIDKIKLDTLEKTKNGFICKTKKQRMYLWADDKGYSEIISYKDTYTVSKDFILEAHESACSTWKTKIENQFPELFPKVELEVGKWYKRRGELLVWNGGKNTYGFVESGSFYNDMAFTLTKSVIPATKEEVETALIAEAKKRGFKEGVNIVDLYNGKSKGDYVLISSDDFDYEKVPCGKLQGKIALRDSDGNILFVDGVWAEIISEPIELSLDEIAKKFGVDVSLIKIKK